ncbi:MAG: VOC family protein [Capsulimonas sp.]|uniref:VOC family protein n=1 Tax=Capsulimonas sp. TaxID=2494211 RepID=UPI0032650D4F
MIINCYLGFDGQCKEAFEFYQKVFGGEIVMMMAYGDSPVGEQIPEDQRGRIMYTRLDIGANVLMGGDSPTQFPGKAQGFSVSITLECIEEGQRVFSALSENGSVMMRFEKSFFSAGFGMLTDQYGIPWMINVAA